MLCYVGFQYVFKKKFFLDCLDFGNNKKAVSEAEKVIKKHDLMAAKVNNLFYTYQGWLNLS